MKNFNLCGRIAMRRNCIRFSSLLLMAAALLAGGVFNGTIDASTVGITEVTRVIWNVDSYIGKGRYDDALDYINKVQRANKGNKNLQSLLNDMSEEIEAKKSSERNGAGGINE
jgi:hypothetical protein